MVGLSAIGNIYLDVALVAGKNLVLKPAAGMTALQIFLQYTSKTKINPIFP